QAMARKALDDGLVRSDESRGWRGPVAQVAPGSDWGVTLGDQKAFADLAPWRLALVLNVGPTGATVGLQPGRDRSGALSPARDTLLVTQGGVAWTRKPVASALKPGDVVYVEPLADKPGEARLRQIPKIEGAFVAMDPYTGRVLAMVGGFSFDESQYNRAVQAQRQPGSSFKPFVYATAIDNGYTPSSIILDAPIEVQQPDGTIWSPQNFEHKSGGPHTLRYAVEHSINQMTVRLAQDIGMPLIADYAKRFGIYDDMLPVLAMSLGAGETTLMRLSAAYGMLDNGGVRITPTLIDRIQDRWGHTIYRHDQRKCEGCNAAHWGNGLPEPTLVDDSPRVIDPMTAYQITSILQGVITRGTGQVIASLHRNLAGKTGTTNQAKDLWFMGYSPNLVAGVFLGYDKPSPLGNNSTQAAFYAAPIFRDFMGAALKGKPDAPFPIPAGIKLVSVDPHTGLRARGPGSMLEAFKPGTEPPDGYSTSPIGPTAGSGVTISPASSVVMGSGTGGLY
ncbi:MAG: penicillin-binding protein, partial [Hyphomicrobiales bacterium]|nr:penicillin-binding protein [Hyphomicrobiales bacterium]